MKSIKEKQLLVRWSRAMNEPVDLALAEEVDRYNQLQEEVKESIRSNTINDLFDASKVTVNNIKKATLDYPTPPTLEELLSIVQEESNELVQAQTIQASLTTEEAPTPSATVTESLIDRTVTHIAKEVRSEENSYQQPDADLSGRSVNDIRKKLKFLEDWVSKISLTGPGGGAGDVINLDHPVKVVTGDYTLTRRDYYVGVNATSAVYITIPDSISFPGRRIIIKDESGRCSKYPIIVFGNVDNDPGGFILRINNGAIQMIYREGWRIV